MPSRYEYQDPAPAQGPDVGDPNIERYEVVIVTTSRESYTVRSFPTRGEADIEANTVMAKIEASRDRSHIRGANVIYASTIDGWWQVRPEAIEAVGIIPIAYKIEQRPPGEIYPPKFSEGGVIPDAVPWDRQPGEQLIPLDEIAGQDAGAYGWVKRPVGDPDEQ